MRGHHHGPCGGGPGRGRRRGVGSREQWLRRLEEYRRDLEQELADVSDLIGRLRDTGEPGAASGTQTV